MVKINKIYTKTGDDGDTGLVGGARIGKDSLRVAAYGDVDELNSHLGLIRTLAEKEKKTELSELLSRIQNELFDVGSLLATSAGASWPGMPIIDDSHVSAIEGAIDAAIDGLPELRSFVLPGGTAINANLHIARTVCRRAERTVTSLNRAESVPLTVRKFLNRLSDLLFALARRESHDSKTPEYLWVPGKK